MQIVPPFVALILVIFLTPILAAPTSYASLLLEIRNENQHCCGWSNPGHVCDCWVDPLLGCNCRWFGTLWPKDSMVRDKYGFFWLEGGRYSGNEKKERNRKSTRWKRYHYIFFFSRISYHRNTNTARLNIYNFAFTGSLSPTSAFAFSLMIFLKILPDYSVLAPTPH